MINYLIIKICSIINNYILVFHWIILLRKLFLILYKQLKAVVNVVTNIMNKTMYFENCKILNEALLFLWMNYYVTLR